MNVMRIAAASAFVFGPLFGAALAAEADMASMLAEATQLTKEKTEVAQKVQENLRAAEKLNLERDQLLPVANRLEAQSEQLDAEKQRIIPLCTGSVPEPQWAAAQARCDAVRNPYNARVEAHNRAYLETKKQLDDLLRRHDANRNEAQQLAARDRQIDMRLSVLRELMATAGGCAACAKAPSAQMDSCFRACYDGAARRPDLAPQDIRPPFSASTQSGAVVVVPPNSGQRTPEQAIREYQQSGAANPLPGTFRRTVPPPPPPSIR